jgi:hypothetical protein
MRTDIQRFYRFKMGKQHMAAQIVVAFTIAVLDVQVLALPQNIAAGDMVNILSAVGLEAFYPASYDPSRFRYMRRVA